MRRFFMRVLCALALTSLLGCDDAKTFVKDSKEGYRELEKIAAQLGDIAAAVSTNDFAQAKEISGKLEPFLNTRVLSWVVQILAIEEKEGVEAARAAIERLEASKDITASERPALSKMRDHYREQTGRTGDLLVWVAAVAVESKYRAHGTGAVFIRLCQKFRTQPSTNSISKTNISGVR